MPLKNRNFDDDLKKYLSPFHEVIIKFIKSKIYEQVKKKKIMTCFY